MTLADIEGVSDMEYLVVETCSNQRLMELGVVPGAKLKITQVMGGNLIIHICGLSSQFALNSISAECVEVSIVDQLQ